MSEDRFKITRRHYDIVIKQARMNLPQECGGFFGGSNHTISAILPQFNQHLEDKTGTFAVTNEDILRAHAFFEKNNLEYFGIYHTHPKGTADPSAQDLKHIQKYMFIISMRVPDHPDFAAYFVKGRDYRRVPLEIIEHSDVVDIHTGKPSKKAELPKDKVGNLHQESDRLQTQLGQYISGKKINYEKQKTNPLNQNSDFSTLA